ncbi:hypothetical protein D3C71_2231590 [compost metagenome]
MANHREQGNDGNNRLRQGQHNGEKVAEVTAAVHFCRLQKLMGNGGLDKGSGNNHVVHG